MTKKVAAKRSGGRPATGSIVWEDPETTTKPIGVRVTKANGKRALVRFDPGTTAEDAVSLAPVVASGARFAVGDHEGETVSQYVGRWCDWRKERGLQCAEADRARLECHVFPIVGALGITNVSRDDLKRVVAALDAKARAGFYRTAERRRRPFAWKSAVNVWSNVRALFRDACSAKRVDLCVRDDNPANGVAGPDTGAKKAKTYLWPSEFLSLVSSSRVPLKWRRMFAISTYLYARAGEVNALRWEDVDLERGVVLIHRSFNRETGELKSTKSDTARRIPIEPELRPLLEAMHRESRGRGIVAPVRGTDRKLSRQIRRCLDLAGITRAELFAMRDPTRKAMTFHDLRATGVTWCAVRGDDPLKIKQRAGHASFSTTEGYIREAENLRAGFGEVFPPLPPSLLAVPAKTGRRVSASVSAFGSIPGPVRTNETSAGNRPRLYEGPLWGRSTGEAMTKHWGGERSCAPRPEVEAPGIEPGSENSSLAHLRT
jgi:integrase